MSEPTPESAGAAPMGMGKRRRANPARARMLGGKSVRTEQQRECDLALMARMMSQGLGPFAVLDALNAQRPYTLGIHQVRREMKLVTARWRVFAKQKINAQKAYALAKIDELESRAWAQIDKLESGQTKETTTVTSLAMTKGEEGKQTPSGTVRKVKTKGHELMLATWLRTLQWCIEQRAKLFGLYAPLKIDAGKGGGLLSLPQGGDTINLNVTFGGGKTPEEIAASFPIIDVSTEEVTEETE